VPDTRQANRKDAVNPARRDAFPGTDPASTFVGATGFVFPDLMVEIDAWANLDIDLSALEDA
jgi:enamine deaminase RidA (YjgF/YER057c/UK114 family)